MTCQNPSHLHMTCGRCAYDVRMTYVIRHLKSPTKSHSHVIRTSSARRPRVVRTSSAGRTHETSVPRLFQVKQQRTALLIKTIHFIWEHSEVSLASSYYSDPYTIVTDIYSTKKSVKYLYCV